MPPDDELARAWRLTAASLPDGWRLDGIRCTSTGLAAEQRGTRWRAVAIGPDDATLEGEGDGPLDALGDLRARAAPPLSP